MNKPYELRKAAATMLQDAPRVAPPERTIPIRELSPTEILQQGTKTLATIMRTLDKCAAELDHRVSEGSMTKHDVKMLSDLVRSHSILRQTQLQEDQFQRQTQTLASDADVANLLVEAVAAGGPKAIKTLKAAISQLEDEDAGPTDMLEGR